MFSINIMILVLLIPFVGFGILYAVFPRKIKNIIMTIIPKWNKRYVVCHLRYQAGKEDIFNVIQNNQGLTKVGNYSYDLKEKYRTLRFKQRDHYILDENNSIPCTLIEQDQDTIIYQAAEIQTALNNSVMDYLFSRKKEWLIWGLFALVFICAIAIAYNIIVLNDIKASLHPIPVSVMVKP